ncbi:MAG: energy transducer TonB [Blastocatellia bacterium]|nr:energy transducer TonB [Blastocatellia bacterium]
MKILKLTILIITLTVLGNNAYSQSDREQGIELFRSGEYEKALPILQARVVEEKRDRPAWIYLGAVLVKLGKLDEAKAAFGNHKTIYKGSISAVYEKKLKIINRPQAIYSSKARSKGTSGTVSIAVEMRGDGKIGFVVPFVELPDGLTESSVKAANSLKFEPAWKDGKPVTTVNIIDYSFNTY